MAKHLFTFLLFVTFYGTSFAQKDTIVNGKHYNTILYIKNFDYKGSTKSSVIVAFGNTVDSVKHGRWMYVLPSGRVLAVGKYRNGFKKGEWLYAGINGYASVVWKKSDKVKDYIQFKDNQFPEVVDYDDKKNILKINGIFPPTPPIRFL